ncbi:hypothetical protein T439DRAFT_110845, partial [Meredithblackwellia eburnea MCA 4105]
PAKTGAPNRRRRRESSTDSDNSEESTGSILGEHESAAKFRKSAEGHGQDYKCTLPPTCSSSKPTYHASLAALEAHNRTYHSFVCRGRPLVLNDQDEPLEVIEQGSGTRGDTGSECGRVFPSERLLELHLRECHDPLLRLKRDKGDKIFSCFLEPPICTATFSNPKARRLHLIDKHQYPPQYFFAVTLWGVGDVLKKGGGMVRRDWKPRAGQESSDSEMESHSPERSEGAVQRVSTEDQKQETVESNPALDELSKQLEGTSISFVPRAVRNKGRMKVG